MRALLQAFVDDAAPLAAEAAEAIASVAVAAVAEGSATTPVTPRTVPASSVSHAGLSLHSPLVAAVVGLHLAALAYVAARLAASARRAAEGGKSGAEAKAGARAPPRKVGATYDFGGGGGGGSSFPPLRVLRHKAAQAARAAAASRAGRSLLGTKRDSGEAGGAPTSAVELLIRAGGPTAAAAALPAPSPPRTHQPTMAGAATVGAPLPPTVEAAGGGLPALGVAADALLAGVGAFAARWGLGGGGGEGEREAAC